MNETRHVSRNGVSIRIPNSEVIPSSMTPLNALLQLFMFDMTRIIMHRLTILQSQFPPNTFIFLLKGGNAVKLLNNAIKHNNTFPVMEQDTMDTLGDMDLSILINPYTYDGEDFTRLRNDLFGFVERILVEQMNDSTSDVKLDIKYYIDTLAKFGIVFEEQCGYNSYIREGKHTDLPSTCPFKLQGYIDLKYFNSKYKAYKLNTSLWKLTLSDKKDNKRYELIDISLPHHTDLLKYEYELYSNYGITTLPLNSPYHLITGNISPYVNIGTVQAIYNELQYILAQGLNTREESFAKRANYVKVLKSLGALDFTPTGTSGGQRKTRSKKRRSTKKRRSRI